MLVLFSLNANNIWFGLDFVVVLMWSDQEVLIVFDSWIRPKSAVEFFLQKILIIGLSTKIGGVPRPCLGEPVGLSAPGWVFIDINNNCYWDVSALKNTDD